jgi:hypothetical protein
MIAPRLVRIAGLFAVGVAAMTTAGGQAFAANVCNSVGPSSGAAGTTLTISATGGLTGTTSVTFGGVPATILAGGTDTQIQVTAPTEPAPTVTGAVNITLGSFGFLKSPGVGPTAGGNTILISGTNFNPTVPVVVTGGTCAGTYSFAYSNDVTLVTIGGVSAPFLVGSSTTIEAVAPAGNPGVADIIVSTTNTSSGPNGNVYTYADGGPSVTAIGPTFGLTTGGNTVTISGSGFLPGTLNGGSTATTVSIGGHPATNVTVSNALSLTAVVPPGAAGAADVVVTTPAGNSGDQFLYLYIAPATPMVQAIVNANTSSPYLGTSKGSTVGGDKVTITGANFTGATAVMIGGIAVSSFTIDGPGQITTTTPAAQNGAAGPVNVTVTVPSASPTTGTGTNIFTYATPPPTVQAIAPASGSNLGGTKVTISGSFFTGATAVNFGTVAATSVTVNSDNQITATAPPMSGFTGPVDVTVTTPVPPPPPAGGTTSTSATNPHDVFNYTAPGAPTILQINPGFGPPGTTVVITGTNFTGATSVKFGSNSVVPIVNSGPSPPAGTQITVVTPSGTGTVDVTVTTPNGTATLTKGYTYDAGSAPTVTSVSPNSGPTQGGTLITIKGTFFSGQPQVTVGGVQASSVALISSTEIQAVTPAGTGTQDVRVTTSISASNISAADQFTYTTGSAPAASAPTVNSITPSMGPTAGGTPVTIMGMNLLGATSVTIGGAPATAVTVVNASTITAVTPPGTLGTANVVVTTPSGPSTGGTGLYTYVAGTPTITSITPNTGTTAGGTFVTIKGTNFTAGSTVMIDGSAATGVVVVDATTITGTTPGHAAGTVNVSVTTNTGTATGTNFFTYVAAPPPTVTGISPAVGPTTGNTPVTITGMNFTGATAVTIGGVTATLVQVIGPTTITAVTPQHAAGAVDVKVTTPAGTGTGPSLYTYYAAPAVTGVSPAIGLPAGGATVNISGMNFVIGATTVKFGNTAISPVTVNSPNLITVTAPPGTGTVDITVTTPGGTSVINPADQYTYAAVPVVNSVSPNSGVPGGGTVVTITGTGFTGATAVMFGTSSATSVAVNASGTSITATSPPGTGTVDITVTTPGGTSGTGSSDKFTYVKATTSLTLTSSPNPSVLGQPVTFTAVVTGNSPTGTVTFTKNSVVLGTAPLVNGVAMFTISTLPAGANPVTASYPGDANNAPDPITVTQFVNLPSDSVNLQKMQHSVMPIVGNLSGQAITGAIDNAIGVGFAGNPSVLTPNGNGMTYYFGADTPPDQNTLASQSSAARVKDEFAALGYADGGESGSSPLSAFAGVDRASSSGRPIGLPYAPPREWLAWIDLRGAEFNRNSVGNDLKGLQLNAIAGLTRRFSPGFIVGVLAGYEHFDFTSQAYNGVLKGQGFTAGGYLGWRLTPSLRFTAGATWSDLSAANTSGAASGNFTGRRQLAFGGLTGDYGWGALMLEPSLQAFALWERENAYTDSLGTLQPTEKFSTGRASGGLKVTYPWAAGAGTVAPYAGIYADYYFTSDNTNVVGLTTVPLIRGWGARGTGGIAWTMPGGARLSAGGELSGIGANTHIWTTIVRGNVPF